VPGPLLLLAKFAFTPTQDILTQPLELFPNGSTLDNVDQAWNRYHIGHFFMNTVWVALGSWFSQVLVATTGVRALGAAAPMVASPQLGVLAHAVRAGRGAARAALPDHRRPADRAEPHQQLPGGVAARRRERVQRRARRALLRLAAAGDLRGSQMDGAGPYRLFWSIVLPMSRPIIGVVSVFAVIASWKDFLWPFLVLKSDSVKPLSVYLQSMANVDKGTLMAALAISTAIPIVMFLVFQRMFPARRRTRWSRQGC
jgi:multiple sugar transport system permease protein